MVDGSYGRGDYWSLGVLVAEGIKGGMEMVDGVMLGDCRELIEGVGDGSVDLIFTDPPYERGVCVESCEWLALEAPRVLKPGGSLVVLIGQVTLPDVASLLSETLQFRWPLCMLQREGRHAQMRLSGVEVYWKLGLWYTNGALDNDRRYRMDLVRDMVEVSADAGGARKGHHVWEQSREWSDYYIGALTFEDELVLDPFCGSGTFLVSARELGRRYIGFDVDEAAVETARRRLLGDEQLSLDAGDSV